MSNVYNTDQIHVDIRSKNYRWVQKIKSHPQKTSATFGEEIVVQFYEKFMGNVF